MDRDRVIARMCEGDWVVECENVGLQAIHTIDRDRVILVVLRALATEVVFAVADEYPEGD